jgi:hypothetical protein
VFLRNSRSQPQLSQKAGREENKVDCSWIVSFRENEERFHGPGCTEQRRPTFRFTGCGKGAEFLAAPHVPELTAQGRSGDSCGSLRRGDQDSDNGDDDQQFDERKAFLPPLLAVFIFMEDSPDAPPETARDSFTSAHRGPPVQAV